MAVEARCEQRDAGVQRHHDAFLRVGQHLIGAFLVHLALQPLREFKLNDAWHDTFGALRNFLGQPATQRADGEPFDPRRGVDNTHQRPGSVAVGPVPHTTCLCALGNAGQLRQLGHRHQQHALTLGDENEFLSGLPALLIADRFRDRDLKLFR